MRQLVEFRKHVLKHKHDLNPSKFLEEYAKLTRADMRLKISRGHTDKFYGHFNGRVFPDEECVSQEDAEKLVPT